MRPSRPILREFLAAAATGVVVFGVALFGIELTAATGRIAAFWGANAVWVAAVLAASQRGKLAIGAAGLAGNVAANVATWGFAPLALGLPLCNLAEVWICCFGLQRFTNLDLTRPRTLAVFLGLSAGPASMAAALSAAAMLSLWGGADFVSVAFSWYRADALGLIAFTPLAAAIAGLPLPRYQRPLRPIWAASAALLFVATIYGVFGQSHYPVLFLAGPAMIAVAFQFGFQGSAIALVVTLIAAIYATIHGIGPLPQAYPDLRDQITVIQMFIAVNALTGFAVAAVLAERERLAEQQILAAKAAEAAERRYKLLADHTTDVIVLSDLDHRVEYVSPSVTQMLGYEVAEFIARPLTSLVHDEDRARVMAIGGSLGARRPNAISLHRLKTRGGFYIWVEAAYAFVARDESGAANLLAVMRDVTERQAQEEQLEAAREAAEQGLKVKSEFLAMISHELRTPLNSIVGFSNLLHEGKNLSAEVARRYAGNIETSSKALLSIVDDVMEISKLRAGKIELDMQPFSLSRLVGDATVIMHGEAEAKSLAFAVEVDERIPDRLLGDEVRLRQVLLNLLSNAVKFTERGKVELKVAFVSRGSRFVTTRISVSDTGVGVPPDKLHLLFQRFSQVDQTTWRRFGGTGLGLSISKDLVELMGGSIDVTSREGVGSRFDVDLTLPIVESAVAPLETVARAARPPGPRLKVLVAEDVAMNQELLAALLDGWGYAADIVDDGASVVSAAARERYDVILMDIQMPSMDGVEAARRIRASDGLSRTTPIIAVTANVVPDEIARFRAAGLEDHVGKPFAPETLKAAIERSQPTLVRSPVVEPHEGAASAFDRSALDQLSALVGDRAVMSYLDRLQTQLTSNFFKPPLDEADLATLRRQAHALASTSGMLGFGKLARACMALERKIDHDHSGASGLLADLAEVHAARDRALLLIDELRHPERTRDIG